MNTTTTTALTDVNPKTLNALDLARYCAEVGFEKKAENVVILDLTGRSTITDYFLILSGNSQPQVQAIAESIHKRLRDHGYKIRHEEGFNEGRWAVLDLSDVVVHVFLDQMRDYYNLEALWRDAPRIRVEDRK